MRLLVDHCADVDLQTNVREMMCYLISVTVAMMTMVNYSLQDEYGETALHAASRNGHVNVMTVLVRRGAGVNSLTKVGGVHSSTVEDGMLSLELDEAYTACG